jgi:UDP-GlcNAc:undecaprenyl-phosphate/decaprenyl-phosphate GlcNAc-1-phosphate transferase
MLPLIVSTLIAALLAPLVIWWYRKQGWIEHPENVHHVKKTHANPVPRGGGLVIYGSVVLSAALFLQLDKYLIGILLGGLLLAIVGFLDDIYDLHPLTRLVVGFLAAMIVVSVGIGIAYITNPFEAGVIHLNQPQLILEVFGKVRTIWVVADAFALLFIVWTMNTVNWSKGVDGQLPGFVSIAAIMIGLLSYKFIDDPTQFNTAHLSFIVAGAYIGLLLWNWYPQKMMPGYGGGSLAGYFLSVLAILSGAKVATTLMVLAIPTADALFTITRRMFAGKSPFWGDRGHLHHKLLDVLGWGRRRIAVFYWASSLILGLLSLYLDTWGKIVTMLIVFGLVFSFLIWAKMKQLKP